METLTPYEQAVREDILRFVAQHTNLPISYLAHRFDMSYSEFHRHMMWLQHHGYLSIYGRGEIRVHVIPTYNPYTPYEVRTR